MVDTPGYARMPIDAASSLFGEGMEDACFEAVTHNIRIIAAALWLEEHTNPEEERFVWSYQVRAENHGTETVKLLRCSWAIIDASAYTQHVHDSNFARNGETSLHPNEGFEYAGNVVLRTPSGFMYGLFQTLLPSSRRKFDTVIPTFTLDCPYQSGIIH